MFQKIKKKINKLHCKLGLHEFIAYRGPECREFYDALMDAGLTWPQALSFASPVLCKHCGKIEPGYFRILKKTLKDKGYEPNEQRPQTHD